MNLLTPSGYKNIEDVNIGDEVIAYEINTGQQILNILLGKDLWTHNMLPENPETYKIDEEGNILLDDNGNPIIETPIKTSEEVFDETYGDWKFYLINNTWKLYVNQSIWANMKVIHVKDLQIGDIIYDDNDQDIVVTSIQEVSGDEWWRLTISGDHSYISEGITLHNASRYWVGGGSSVNWSATGNTNWGSSSGTLDNSSVPTSADDVTFDGIGVSGNTNSTISATITILSLNITTGYTATMRHNAVLTIAGNLTLNTGYTITGTSAIIISANSTITSNGKSWPNNMTFSNANTKTLNGDFTILGELTFSSTNTINKTGSNDTLSTKLSVPIGAEVYGTVILRITGGFLATSGYGIYVDTLLDGNIQFGSGYSSFFFGNGKTLKYVSGVITFISGFSVQLVGSCTFDTFGINWPSVQFYNNGSLTLTLNSKLDANFIRAQGGFAGNFGFETNTLTCGSITGNLTLTTGVTYLVNAAYTNTVGGTVTSNSGTIKAILILKNGATCNTRANFTRIDASGGRTFNTWNGTVTDCINVRRFTDLQGVGTLI